MAEAKVYTLEDLQAHMKKEDLYVLLHGKVYSVTKFIDEHPGGDEVILAEAGKDATEAFEDVGHSDEAREILSGLLIGDFEGGSSTPVKVVAAGSTPTVVPAQQASSLSYFIPLAVLGAYFAWRFYSSGSA